MKNTLITKGKSFTCLLWNKHLDNFHGNKQKQNVQIYEVKKNPFCPDQEHKVSSKKI